MCITYWCPSSSEILLGVSCGWDGKVLDVGYLKEGVVLAPPQVVVGWTCDQYMMLIFNDGLRSKWQLLYCCYIIITADFAALQPGVVTHAAFSFGGGFEWCGCISRFNIETVTAGSEPCNWFPYVSVWNLEVRLKTGGFLCLSVEPQFWWFI